MVDFWRPSTFIESLIETFIETFIETLNVTLIFRIADTFFVAL